MSHTLVRQLAAAIRAEEDARTSGGARLREATKARKAVERTIERAPASSPGGAPERHGRRIAREDARMPKEMWGVLSPPSISGADLRTSRVSPPVSFFASPKGRRFTVVVGTFEMTRWGRQEVWPIYYKGKPAGELVRDLNYGPGIDGKGRWRASTRQLFWTYSTGLKRGGYDVTAFNTVEECLQAWGHSADQILDFHAEHKAER